MNKKIFSGVIASIVLSGIVLAKPVMANEGVVVMKGDGSTGACFGTSVFIDGTYKVLVTCRDLKSALSPEQNLYVVWVTQPDGKVRQLGQIENGKLSTATDVKFINMFVTAEVDGYGTKPSNQVLLTGPMQAINFDYGQPKPGEGLIVAPTPTPKITATPTAAASDVNAAGQKPASNSGIGGALSTVFKIALFGFGALLLIVGVFSFISRKRSL